MWVLFKPRLTQHLQRAVYGKKRATMLAVTGPWMITRRDGPLRTGKGEGWSDGLDSNPQNIWIHLGSTPESVLDTLMSSWSFRKKQGRRETSPRPELWVWPWECQQAYCLVESAVTQPHSRCECPPTSEAAHFEAGESRPLVPSRKQGYNYQTPSLPVTFHSLGLSYSLCWHGPRSLQTELSVPDAQMKEQCLQHPLKLFLISSCYTAFPT